MKIRIHTSSSRIGFCAISLETEPPPEGDTNSTFFTLHASPLGAEVVLFLRSEDQRQLLAALEDHLLNEEREIQA